MKQYFMFNVVFFGTYVPLHGAEYIVQAAKLLERESAIRFTFIGNGQDRKKIFDTVQYLELKNIEFKAMLDPVHLRQEIVGADVCLGIFGDTPKTPLVIPNKVFEALSMKKAVITADTPAIRELFDDDDLLFVRAADPKAIAEAILKLKGDPGFRKAIALCGHQKFLRFASYQVIGKELATIIHEYIY